jgi:uncharacterized spore protein YtfJ
MSTDTITEGVKEAGALCRDGITESQLPEPVERVVARTAGPIAGSLSESSTKRSIDDEIRGTLDAMSVRRVFGDPYVADGVTIVPVARVTGAAGGGGGEGTGPGSTGGRGFGSSFGLGAHPVGIYKICDGKVKWKPTIDVNRLLRSTQVLAGIIAVCTVLLSRKNRR